MNAAQVDPEGAHSVEEELLDLGLADVHERREVVARAARQLDAEELPAAEIGARRLPLDPALCHPFADVHSSTTPSRNLQAARGSVPMNV